ncbi:MAG: hypothetical protein JJ964_15925 [Rhizobiales bacterium]|nr:hypothetical protein [Hyphomicrobiales bacterium]
MPRLQKEDCIEIINEILEQNSNLRLSIGIQLIELGFYWTDISSDDGFLKEYVETYFYQNYDKKILLQ